MEKFEFEHTIIQKSTVSSIYFSTRDGVSIEDSRRPRTMEFLDRRHGTYYMQIPIH